MKEIEELKNRLKGIEEGLMFFQESTTRLLQLGKKISIDVGKVRLTIDEFK